jgi:L-iditol 2-dehydrogenase
LVIDGQEDNETRAQAAVSPKSQISNHKSQIFMRAFVQTAVGAFSERDLPIPHAGRGEVVLRVRAALTCGTDLKLLDRGHSKIALPVTMGHEACGEIVELGEGVVEFRTGDRVVPGISGPCGACDRCGAGRANLCLEGHADRTWGAFAEYLRVPAAVVAANLHRVPDGLADEIAAFLDPLASVLHGWNRLSHRGSHFLIYGSGALALLWAQVVRWRGARATVAARRPDRLAVAAALGAETLDVSAGPPDRFDADFAIDCTGSAAVWERLPDLVIAGGQVLLFGGCAPGVRVSFDAARLHYDEISISGSFHYTPQDARTALKALASDELDIRSLLTERGGLSDLPRFLEAQRRGEGIRYAILGDR